MIVATADGAVFFGGDPRRPVSRRPTTPAAEVVADDVTDEDLRGGHMDLRLVQKQDISGYPLTGRTREAAA